MSSSSSHTIPSDQSFDPDSNSQTEIWCHTEKQVVSLKFVWTISNFDMVTSEPGEYIESAPFAADGYENIKFRLKLYPKCLSQANPDYMSLYLILDSRDRQEVPTRFSFNIASSDGQPKCVKKAWDAHDFAPGSFWGFEEFAKRSELSNLGMKLLTGNTLKVQCDLRMVVGSFTTSGKRTRFKLKRSECNPISEAMGKMLKSQKFCDVVLVGCDGVELPAHKVLLAGRSAVFASMFDHQMKENIQNRVEIADVSSDVLREVLWYIYTGETPNIARMVKEIFTAADKYALDGLKELCGEFLCRNLTVESAVDVYALADVHNADQLKAFVIGFICDHVIAFGEGSGWKDVLAHHPALVSAVFKTIFARTGEPALKKMKL